MPTATSPPLVFEATWPDGERAAVRLGPPLAEGGDARVHAVEGEPGLVAKVYHDPAAEPRRRAKLEAMLAAPPDGALSAEGGEVALAWPVALLERGGAAKGAAPAGFLMPRVDLSGAVTLEMLLSARARRAAGLPESYRFRASVAANLAALVAALHAQGDHVVDLKPANVLVYRTSGRVAVLDCDGFSVAGWGGDRFPAHQYTDGYIAPEALRARARPEDLGEGQDRFALAVVVFRLLCNGLHPFQGVPRPGADVPTTDGERVAARLYPYGSGQGALRPPPSSLHDAFDRRTQVLFGMAFDGPPGERPSAADWRGHLRGLLAGGLRSCERDADHARYGRKPCAMCPPAPPPEPEQTPDRLAKPTAGPARPPYQTPAQRREGGVAASLLVVGLLVFCFGCPALLIYAVGGAGEYDYGMSGLEYGYLDHVEEAIHDGADVTRGLTMEAPDASPDDYRPTYAPLNDALGFPEWTGRDRTPLSGLRPEFETAPGRTRQDPPSYLHTAAWQRTPTGAALLLRAGAPAGGYYRGRTALMLAAANAGTPVALGDRSVGLVVRAGRSLARATERYLATPRRKRGPRPDTTLAGTPGLLDLTRQLPRRPYAEGSDEHTVGRGGAALALARNAAVVDLLLRHGADPDAADMWGRTALVYAASVGNAATVRQLLDAGADPDLADAAGATPLMVAADRAATPTSDRAAAAVVALLLAAGADPDATDAVGRTAADYVGERDETWRAKTLVLGASDTTRLERSSALGRLRAASAGGAEAAQGASEPPAPPALRADVGDGRTRFGAEPDTLGTWWLEPFPWPNDVADGAALVVSCDGVEPGRLQVDVWLTRDDAFGGGYHAESQFFIGRPWKAYSPAWDVVSDGYPWSYERKSAEKRCLEVVRRTLSETRTGDYSFQYRRYNLRGEAERWPRATVTVDVLPAPAEGP